ncbi:hypothetical protein G4B88_007368, partial [Cannabis sativa]
MNRASSLFQFWQTPRAGILFRSLKLYQSFPFLHGHFIFIYVLQVVITATVWQLFRLGVVLFGDDVLMYTTRAGLYVIPGVKFYPSPCSCKNIQTTSYEDVNGKASYVPTINFKNEIDEKDKSSEKLQVVGAFQKLPMVMASFDILSSALKKAKRISPTKGTANIAKQERSRGAKQLDALMKELVVPLRTYMENFPKRHTLHPYERSLIELTLGDGKYEEVLNSVDSLRKKVVSVAKEHASLCAKSITKREAQDRLVEGMKKVEATFNHNRKAIDDLLNIAKTLRAMPLVDLETPTLCLVGAPNVGKSSLVRVLSTGKSEICNYPFTTRGILIGHIVSNYQHFQVTDTPGLLRRCDEDRNNLEKLTLAVLSHLPTVVLYIHDLSGECGTSPFDQCDLLQDSPMVFVTKNADEDGLELAKYRAMGPDGALNVSITDEVGLSK